MNCAHQNVKAVVEVNRLSNKEGGPITHYMAEIRITCTDCNIPFVFPGVPIGYNVGMPHASADGQELRAPLRPANEFAEVGGDLVGRQMRERGNA